MRIDWESLNTVPEGALQVWIPFQPSEHALRD